MNRCFLIIYVFILVSEKIQSQDYDKLLDSLWNQIYVNPDSAEKKALKYINDNSIKKSDNLMASFSNLLGAIYIQRSEYTKAVKYFQVSVEYNRRIKNERGENVVIFNIGTIYLKISDPKKALFYFKKTQKYFEKTNDTISLPNVYNNIGLCYMHFGAYEKALYYIKKANILFKNNHDITNLLLTTLNLADIFLKLKMPDSSLIYYREALAYSGKIGDVNNKFICMKNIMDILRMGKQYDSLKKEILKFNLNDLQDEQKMEFLIFKINNYIGKKDYKNAYHTFVTLDSIKYNLLSNEKQYDTRLLLIQNEFNELRRTDSIRTANEKKLASLKLEKQQAENQKNNLLKWSFIVVSLIVSVFLLILFNRFKIIRKQKEIIEEQQKITNHQKELIEEKQKEILDSINYAQRIQNSLINDYKKFFEYFSDSFFIYYPKDIVSGDFIWITEVNNFLFVSCCDSTGHGVPGSYMSLLNMAFLSEAVNEKNILTPSEILNYVRQRLINSISKNKENKDGFDGSVIRFNVEKGKVIPGEIQWASANQRIILIKNNEPEVLSYDRMPVGYYENIKPFTNHVGDITIGNVIVLSTDGYYDQFGGEYNKKYTFKRFLIHFDTDDLVLLNSRFEKSFMDWKNHNIQTDDVCVIGLKI